MTGAYAEVRGTWWRDSGMVKNQVPAKVPSLGEISAFSGEGMIRRQCGYDGMVD